MRRGMSNGRAQPKPEPSATHRGKSKTKADLQRVLEELRTRRPVIRAKRREETRGSSERVEAGQDGQEVAKLTGYEANRAAVRSRARRLLRHRDAELRLGALPKRLLVREPRKNRSPIHLAHSARRRAAQTVHYAQAATTQLETRERYSVAAQGSQSR